MSVGGLSPAVSVQYQYLTGASSISEAKNKTFDLDEAKGWLRPNKDSTSAELQKGIDC